MGSKKGGRNVGLSHPVACCGDMSFSSIHREKRRQQRQRGMKQWRKKIEIQAPSSPALSQKPEASAMAGNLPPQTSHRTKDMKKSRQHVQNSVLFLHNH